MRLNILKCTAKGSKSYPLPEMQEDVIEKSWEDGINHEQLVSCYLLGIAHMVHHYNQPSRAITSQGYNMEGY